MLSVGLDVCGDYLGYIAIEQFSALEFCLFLCSRG